MIPASHRRPRRRRRARAPLLAATVVLVLGLATDVLGRETPPDPAAGFATIRSPEVERDVRLLGAPSLEGRDSPSAGLAAAADYIAERLAAAGAEGAGADGAYRVPFGRILPAPASDGCALRVVRDGEVRHEFALGRDFAPVWRAAGLARGEAVFLGYGIDSAVERYDDVPADLSGRIAVILTGEPRCGRRFDGDDVSGEADVYRKLAALRAARAAGALVVRPPLADDGEDRLGPPRSFGFRHGWALWHGERPRRLRSMPLPALEVAPIVARALFGADVWELAASIDGDCAPPTPLRSGREITVASRTAYARVDTDNVVAVLRGSDPELADEYVVLGAHYDHVGVDTRGRVGPGADDNASGVAAMLEVVDALAVQRPRRSVLVCAFAGEEDGLLGSRALCADPPVPPDALVAMINLDMVGRGDVDECAVIGLERNPGLEPFLDEALDMQPTGIDSVQVRQGEELFERSDHFPFHQIGVPALFVFEQLPLSRNADYHTWRDTAEKVDAEKVTRTARLVFNLVWLLAEADERPPPPQR